MLEKTHFEITEDDMYWFDDDGGKHKIVRAGVCANGLRDLCIYWKGPKMWDISVGKTADVSKERILWIPKGDILWLAFEPPFADVRHFVYVDITSDPQIEDMVKTMFRRFKWGVKGKDYDMYGGKDYGKP